MPDRSPSYDSRDGSSPEPERNRERPVERPVDRDKGREKEKEKEIRDRERDRARDRERDKERDQYRDMERDMDRDIDRDIDRDVDRDIERDKDRDKERDREKEKIRDRDRLLNDKKDKEREKPLDEKKDRIKPMDDIRDSRDNSPGDRRGDRNRPLNDRRDTRDKSPDDRGDRDRNKPLNNRRDSFDSSPDKKDRKPLNSRRDSYDSSPDKRDRKPLNNRKDSYDSLLDKKDRKPLNNRKDSYDSLLDKDRKPLDDRRDSRDRSPDDRRDRDRSKPLNNRRNSFDSLPDKKDRKPLDDRRDSRDRSPDDKRYHDRNRPLDDPRDSRDRSPEDKRDRDRNRPLDDRRDSRDRSLDDSRRDRDRIRQFDDRRDSRDRSLDGRRDSRDYGKDRDYDDPRDSRHDVGRDHANGRDRLKDRDVDRRRDSRIPPRVAREPREHPPSASKRNSITGRLLGSFRAARGGGDKEKEIPMPAAAASIQRRASTAVTKGSPVTRIREWLDACNAEHHHHCALSSESDVPTWRPTWLVDVVDRRLVKATTKDRYLALSYVNGSHRNEPQEFMQLLKSNLAAFEDRLPNLDMPQTYLDAMWLAKKLGIRYIWIDRICITQDNREEMEDHTKHMAYVFANAYLVIVAASGDIHTGLPSLDPKRSTRGIRTTGRTHQELVAASSWYTRGWTLVERIYSRRSVFFFEDSVTWECHCDTWQGSPNSVMKKLRGGRQECVGAIPDAVFAFQHPRWPDLDEYARYVMEYSARKLTLVDDTLPAFSGITHVLSRSFPGGFIYGMPIMFLDIALLWRPHASIRRRALSRPPFLPSWSWMGWWFDNIPVDLTLWRAAADYVEEARTGKRGQESKRYRSAHAFRIRPTVSWSLTDRASTVPLMNTGLQYNNLRSRRVPNTELPMGWSRSGSHYVHDSDETALFKYPVPVEDPHDSGGYEPAVGEQAYPGPLLSFRTTSGFFEIEFHTTLAHRERPNPPLAVGTIWNKAGRWAGQFRAHDAWLGIQSSNYDGEERLEFICVSIATERKGSHVFDTDKFEEHMDADGMVDFVNVLWIERIGDIAYRRGVGQILLKTWEAQAKDEVAILLG
ncbi:hypothetical protein FPSE_09078 [Fusarium pseudograminearum CS3096]|uniref:Heterokaryon incompatibility domain-containing protein n=2 Tax=Fusarium pseudograminearum TaxID=101028 RepID=K3VDS4_FUSPC|nr:hypothetical protein FPSE_09078 [Fusarium pseudograminearum CS3096]EKJ70708.1 hypothetical protein FPSE_09078 [Fusarium pseudograminearum CS3096]